MPELPEVETVRRGISPYLEGRTLVGVEARRPDLRWPLPADFAEALTGAKVTRINRRAKYLLIETTGPTLLLHLGMSGSIRIDAGAGSSKIEKHDHLVFRTDAGATLVFNDPRRFGAALFLEPGHEDEHPLLAKLGPEPLSNAFNVESLSAALAGKKTPIKAALLDQRIVAGLGNIYVCEALFAAGISPRRQALSIPGKRAERLVPAIRDVLRAALEAGGSSLRDHIQVNGELGYFQHNFKVYDQAGQPCQAPGCSGTISQLVQSGRSTYFCPRCQH